MKIQTAEQIPANEVHADGVVGVQMRWLVGPDDQAPNFYMRQFTVAPKGQTFRHTHPWEHEVYILAGSGVVVSADGDKPFKAGDCIYVAPREDHQFRNTGAGDVEMLCLVPVSAGG